MGNLFFPFSEYFLMSLMTSEPKQNLVLFFNIVYFSKTAYFYYNTTQSKNEKRRISNENLIVFNHTLSKNEEKRISNENLVVFNLTSDINHNVNGKNSELYKNLTFPCTNTSDRPLQKGKNLITFFCIHLQPIEQQNLFSIYCDQK